MVNRDCTYLFANKFFEKFVNRTSKEIYGKTVHQIFPENVAQQIESIIQKVIKSKKILRHENEITHSDGTKENLLLTRVPLLDEDDEVYAVCNYSINITELKQLENELRLAKEKTDEAVKVKSSFLANMSHEIRTPMNSILGYLSLLLKDPTLFDAQKNFVETAYRSAHSLLSLINDILDISKLESGRIEPENIPFNLDNFVHEIIGMMDLQAAEKGISLNWNMKPELSGNYMGDPLRLKQILVNLVGNAIKFTKHGTVSIDIDHAENEQGLYFQVTDTGIGISPDRLESIFEPFTQEDSSTSRRYGGTGLGTTIVKQLVELMDGRIWIESELGKGSIFCFTIPMHPTDQIPSTLIENIHTDLEVNQDPSQSYRRFKILLVEDIEENIKLALIRLEMNGHRVSIAKNGKEALDAFKNEKPDLILMDIHMPLMDGPEATRQIRKLENDSDSHVPIIALTASVMKEEIENCKKAGMDDIVGKPIDFDQLFWIMEKTVPADCGDVIHIGEIPELEVVSERSIPLLNGIDVDKGLYVWKDLQLYTNTLITFSGNYRNIVSEIREDLQIGNFREICQTAHKLKGVAGNLSITGIFEISSQIEIAGEENDLVTLDILLKALEEAMDEVVVSISGLKSVENEIIKTSRKVDTSAVSIILKKLIESLSEFNPGACEPHVALLSEYFPFEKVSVISTSINNFDFEAAEQAARHFAQQLEIPLED
jgi:PAS domain S-box-containing protein